MVRKSLIVKLFVVGLLVSGLSSKGFTASRAEVLFQEAMVKESGERDPEAALKLYQDVVAQSGSNKRLAAKARLQQGSCLERLGKPKEAEAMYLSVIKDSNASGADTVQSAQANLERLQAQEKKAREDAEKSKPMMIVKEFQATRFTVLGGPSYISGADAGLSIAGRYRLSSPKRPLALYGEIGLLFPIGGSTVDEATKPFNSQTDHASLKLGYQFHLGLTAELPHGKQNKTIPEFGIGAARTKSTVEYTSTGSGETDETTWSPYISLGVRFWADKRVSFLLSTQYTANPYNKAIDIDNPAHIQTFEFPTGMWAVKAQVHVKIGKTVTAMRPKE